MNHKTQFEIKQFREASKKIQHDVNLLLANKNALKKDMNFRLRKFVEHTLQELATYEGCIQQREKNQYE